MVTVGAYEAKGQLVQSPIKHGSSTWQTSNMIFLIFLSLMFTRQKQINASTVALSAESSLELLNGRNTTWSRRKLINAHVTRNALQRFKNECLYANYCSGEYISKVGQCWHDIIRIEFRSEVWNHAKTMDFLIVTFGGLYKPGFEFDSGESKPWVSVRRSSNFRMGYIYIYTLVS